jgi:hypothetical protein
LSVVLKENKICNYVNSVVVAPTIDLVALDLHEIKEAKAQRIILDGVKDHLIPHLAEKNKTKDMWYVLMNATMGDILQLTNLGDVEHSRYVSLSLNLQTREKSLKKGLWFLPEIELGM